MKPIFKALIGGFFGAVLTCGYLVHNEAAASLKAVSSGAVAADGTVTTTSLLLPSGSATAPGAQWAADNDATGTGLYRRIADVISLSTNGTGSFEFNAARLILISSGSLEWNSGAIGSATDITLVRDAADVLAQKHGTTPQTLRVYASTTGPIHFGMTARAAGGAVLTGTGAPMQLSTVQTTAPTCTTNCGTSPSVAGTDTAMRVTMGASGVPASAWVVTFNGTWGAAPVCNVQSALATMVVGKMAIAVVTTTTTITVTTNGTAPATSDQYQIICMGVA